MAIIQRRLCAKRYIKKGITMIEIVITAGLIEMLAASQITIFSRTYLQYKNHLEYCKEDMYAKETFEIIENQMTDNCKSVIIMDNCIEIKKIEGTKSKIYFKKTGESCGNVALKQGGATPRYLIENVKNFKIYAKGKILYLTILTDSGSEFNRCLAMERTP